MAKKVDINSLIKAHEIIIGDHKLSIRPSKVRYFENNFYNVYILIREIGFVTLVSKYTDGKELISKFLIAVFNLLDKEGNISEENQKLLDDIYSELDVKIFNDIIEKANIVNEIKDDESKNVLEEPRGV